MFGERLPRGGEEGEGPVRGETSLLHLLIYLTPSLKTAVLQKEQSLSLRMAEQSLTVSSPN